MRVRPSDIPGFPDDFEYRSPFPPATMTDGTVGDPHFQLALDSLPNRSWEAASRLTRVAAGRAAVTWGVFPRQFDALKRLGDLGSLSLGDAFVGLAEGRKLAGDLLAFSDAIVEVVSRVPVVGPYARVLVTFGKLLVQAFRAGKEQKLTTTKNRPLGYAREDDEFVVRDAVARFAARDWTRIFCPAWDGGAFELADVSFVGNGTPDGAFVMPRGGWLPFADVGLGCVPGVAGRFVGWQYPKKLPGSSRDAGPESLMSVASFEPSATQLSMLAWQMVLKNSPRLFRVNAYEVKSRWMDFFSELLEWAAWLEDEGHDQGASMARAVGMWAHRGEHTGGRWEVRDPWKKFKPSKMPTDVTENAGTLVRHIVHKQLERSQSAALGTLMCAYVEPNANRFSAMRNPLLRDYCVEMRKLLLTEPERACRVELDMVPDADYRRELERVRKNCPTRTTPEDPKRRPKRVAPKGWGDEEDVDPDPEEPPSDDEVEPSGPGLGQGGESEGGGGGAVVAAAAVGLPLAAWGVSKLLKRRR